jgi:predicted TIM-barrel fold metal-dependent hydrolase
VIIDADASVVENERTWDFMEPPDNRYRPQLVELPDANPTPHAWAIFNSVGGSQAFVWPVPARAPGSAWEQSELTDVGARIRLLDSAGIDVQVLHSTMFMRQVTDQPHVDVPVCRAWNHWMADIWRQGGGRIRWTCVPPVSTIPDALDELRFGKEHGAVGVLLRSIEGERVLTDPYFYPLYEEAQRLNMPIVVRIGNGNAWYYDLYQTDYTDADSFGQFHMPAVVFCHQLTVSRLPRLFPTLRWGVLGAGAQWLPWIVKEAQRRLTKGQNWPAEGFAAFRTYVTCSAKNDMPEILKYSGEGALVFGTGYGSSTASSNGDAVEEFRQKAGVEPRIVARILDDNAREFYGL